MNPRILTILVVIFIGLLGLFLFQGSAERQQTAASSQRLFADIEARAGDINKIIVQQAESQFELEVKDGVWTIPSRDGYKADQNKVRSLLLKALGLIVSQNVTSNPENFESLGVTEEAVKTGRGSVTFKNKADQVISGMYFGEFRKSQHSTGMPAPVGQYVRRIDQNDVYLISDPISVVTTLTYWIDTTIANILQSRVREVEQHRVNNGEQVLEFKLSRGNTGELELIGDTPQGKTANGVTLTQIRSSLENLRIEDMQLAGTAKGESLEFNLLSRFFLMNGLIYEVLTAEADDVYFAKVRVGFDEEYVKAEKKVHEEALVLAEAQKELDPEGAQAAVAKPELPEFASLEQANKLNQSEYSTWIYILPKYLGQKFRHTRSSLFDETTS